MWEYRIVELATADGKVPFQSGLKADQVAFDQYGAASWELVAVAGGLAYFKRKA